MNRQLKGIGAVPVTTSVIESLYPELKSADKKVVWLEKNGYIIRLKRGLYVVNPEHSGKMLSSELIANHLYAPSYISMLTALRYYGLIPEAVYTHQSMTVKHSRSFQGHPWSRLCRTGCKHSGPVPRCRSWWSAWLQWI